MNAISRRLNTLPQVFSPLREHAMRHLHSGTKIDENGAVSIGRNPNVAPEYFVFRIYPPSNPDWLVRRRSYEVPIEYLRFLAATNGCFAYGMSLYGFTPSMEAYGLLDRSSVQCHDLTTASEVWC